MDFSKVQLAQPREESATNSGNREKDYVERGNLSALSTCKGEDCCPATDKDANEVTWDSTIGKCIPYSSS